jgi:hypothetical protein
MGQFEKTPHQLVSDEALIQEELEIGKELGQWIHRPIERLFQRKGDPSLYLWIYTHYVLRLFRFFTNAFKDFFEIGAH